MRIRASDKLERGRLMDRPFASPRGAIWGAFEVMGPCGCALRIISSDGVDAISEGWEHVSISTPRRPPNWQEMCFVKDLFWNPDECVVQYHPPEASYVNNHPHCLHLWRSRTTAFPMPPSILVGLKDAGLLTPEGAAQLRKEIGL